MKLSRAAMILIGTGALLIGPPAAVSASAATPPVEIDLSGPVASDQTPAIGSLITDDLVTTPAATSVNGDSTAGLTSSQVSRYYIDSPDQLQAYTSTESGTSAVTGVVVGNSDVVPGATVTLTPSSGGSATTVTTDSNGGFAFVDIPVGSSGTAYTLTVAAPGYGSYTVTNDTYIPDLTYEMTVNLSAGSQSYDASQSVSQGTQNTSASGSLGPYTSFHRPPPVITVAMYKQGAACTPSGSYTVKKYPFGYYALETTASEIVHGWPEAVVRANMLAVTNYAWYFLRHPPNSTYNVDDTTDFQCFETWQKVPTSWSGWLSGVLGDSALLKSGDTEITQFRAGNKKCSDPAFPQNGDVLSQWGSYWLNKYCGYSYYKDIDSYYYTGTFASNTIPPVPNTSYSRPSGAIKFNFPSQVSDGNGHTSNVAWKYTLEVYLSQPAAGWYRIYDKGWDWQSRSIPTSYTHNVGGCFPYRVSATSPVGTSRYASFNGGQPQRHRRSPRPLPASCQPPAAGPGAVPRDR